MAGPKADKLTKERRVEAVYRLILEGWTPEQIRSNTAEWGLGPSQVRRYMREARQRFETVTALTRAELLAEHIAARRQMRREAKNTRDKLAVLKDEAELLGLYPAKGIALQGADGGPVAFRDDTLAGLSDDELRRNLAALGRVAVLAADGGTSGADDAGGLAGVHSAGEGQ